MPFWRRDEPVHKKLAKALMNAQAGGYLAHPPDLAGNVTTGEVGLHGIPRPRRWDAVVTAIAAQLPGDEVHFTALPDGMLIVEEDVPDEALAPLAEAVEQELEPPYRAEATRRGDELWAVGAVGIDVARIGEEISGDTIELAVQQGERALTIDGMRTFGTIPSLEALTGGLPAYVVRAERLDGELWEVTVAPL
jgi:hypothetical protein